MWGSDPMKTAFEASGWSDRVTAGAMFGMTALQRWNGPICRIVRRGECVARDFWRARRASVAIETAVVLSLVVVSCAGLMEIVSSAYLNDYMDRAARAGARAVALSPDTHSSPGAMQSTACDGIKRELNLGVDFDCASSWTVTIDAQLTPQNLLAGQNPDPGDRTGEMVRVQIGWYRDSWRFGAETFQEGDPVTEPRELAIGVARAEPESVG